MANFDQLKQSVAALIRTNGAEEITGQIMQDVLLTIINSISGGYMFGGVAQHNGNVGNPDYNVFYLAGSGAYTGYGGAITIEAGCYGVFRYNGVWTQEVVDIGVRLSGSIAEGETRGVTGDVINTALQALFENVMNILDTLTFTYNTPSAQQATKAMLDVIMTPTGGASHVFGTLTLASATAAAAGLMSAEDKQKVDRMLTDFRSLSFSDTTAAADQATKIVQTLSATLGENPEAITTMTFLAATASKAGLMSAADKAVLDCLVAMLGYYECSTASGTAAKVVSASGYSLTSGGCIRIKMTNANTANNVTLNINSTGAKALYYDGAQASASNTWEAGEVLEVYYDGTQYQCASGGGGKFATGEKVKDTSITDEVEEGSDDLPTSNAVYEEYAKLAGKIAYYKDGTYITTGSDSDASVLSGFPVVAGHTYRISMKSDVAYTNSASVAWGLGSNGLIGNITPSELLAGTYREKTATTSSGSSRIYFNANPGIANVSIYVKVEDLTDATTMEAHVIQEPTVLFKTDVATSLYQGGDKLVTSEQVMPLSNIRKLPLYELMNLGLSSGNLTIVNNRVGTGSIVMLPEHAITVNYKVPSDIVICFIAGTTAGTYTLNTGWLHDSGSVEFPDNVQFYGVLFAYRSGSGAASTNIAVSTIKGLLDSGGITLTYFAQDNNIEERLKPYQYLKAMSYDITSANTAKIKNLPTFVHGSDIHGDAPRVENLMRYADYIGADGVFLTGDFFAVYSNQGAKFVSEIVNNHVTPTCICIGNHDSYSRGWNVINNQADVFNYHVAPLVETQGYLEAANTPATKTYYYRDYPDAKVRVIALNIYENAGTDVLFISDTQYGFLASRLADTPSEYGVMVLLHEPSADPVAITGAEKWLDGGIQTRLPKIYNIIDTFISRGTYTDGNVTQDFSGVPANVDFICTCSGHYHTDKCGYAEGTTNMILMMNVPSVNSSYSTSYRYWNNGKRYPRHQCDVTQDCFNIYSIDRANGTLRVARAGANTVWNGDNIEWVVIPYKA